MSTEKNEEQEHRKSRVKRVVVRFNREVLPFQHIRIECEAVVYKGDDADEVGEELKEYLSRMSAGVERRIFGKELARKQREALEREEKKNDNVSMDYPETPKQPF